MEHMPSKATIEVELCYQEVLNKGKIEKKAFRLKLLDFCKTKTKKSGPDTFNFYVVLTGYDKVTDADRANRCRRKFKAPSLQKHSTKKRPSKNMGFNTKSFEDFRRKKWNKL